MSACPRCGSAIQPDAPGGLCAACLLLAGSETFASGSADELATVTAHRLDEQNAEGPRLLPAQTWGPYRIGALLGRGGMGEVFEAEHTGSGRRVALKVLRRQLQPGDRARFLREGQLAASISHPHTVYIYGSEEIGGTPVITMELLPGGTLKDRVAAEGPLPAADAVAAVLDIIGGLDAAQAAGILHRDIKPSNCFIEHDGTVKVGDFGLSISTLARDVHAAVATASFEGTPQFAPPEQLRGEPLDVRADIYAVGATAYYLLTGRPPFEAPDLPALVARVTSEPAPSPRTIRRDIPHGLAEIVRWCLAKSPAERPPSYAALAEALRPFAPGAHRPAPLGLRVVAGLVDSAILAVPVVAWNTWGGSGEAAALLNWAFGIGLSFLYYVALEGLWRASLGKRLVGLQVMSAGERPAARRQVAVRTLIFMAGSIVSPAPVIMQVQPAGSSGFSFAWPMPLIVLALLFTTMRRRNGWAGLHEIVSGTRVVTRATATAPAMRRSEPIAVDVRPVSRERCGPFIVLDVPQPIERGELTRGFDPQLRRLVWIHRVPPETPPVSAARRDAGRTTRLRWLTGRRGIENWDAYELPDGEPFAVRASGGVEWCALKRWLTDLANELAAAEREGSLPVLALDRLWVRDDGRLVLADFPVVDAARQRDDPLTPAALLSSVVSVSREPSGRQPSAITLSARALLRRLDSPSPPPVHVIRDEIAAWAPAPERVDWWRRAIPIGLAAAPVVVLAVAALVLLASLMRLADPDTGMMLRFLEDLRQPPGESALDAEERAALERYVAGRYAAQLRDGALWNGAVMQHLGALRGVAHDVVSRHPTVPPAELDQLATTLAPRIARAEAHHRAQANQLAEEAPVVVTTLIAVALLFVLVCSVVSSLAVPGGIMTRLLGLAVVDSDGGEIGRMRSLVRVLIAWSPVAAWLVYLLLSPKMQRWVPNPEAPVLTTAAALGAMAIGAAVVFASGRGIHDRLIGTWLVVR